MKTVLSVVLLLLFNFQIGSAFTTRILTDDGESAMFCDELECSASNSKLPEAIAIDGVTPGKYICIDVVFNETPEPITTTSTTQESTTTERITTTTTSTNPTGQHSTHSDSSTQTQYTSETSTAETTPVTTITTDSSSETPMTVTTTATEPSTSHEPTSMTTTSGNPSSPNPPTLNPTTKESTVNPTPVKPTTSDSSSENPSSAKPTTAGPTTSQPTSINPTSGNPLSSTLKEESAFVENTMKGSTTFNKQQRRSARSAPGLNVLTESKREKQCALQPSNGENLCDEIKKKHEGIVLKCSVSTPRNGSATISSSISMLLVTSLILKIFY